MSWSRCQAFIFFILSWIKQDPELETGAWRFLMVTDRWGVVPYKRGTRNW